MLSGITLYRFLFGLCTIAVAAGINMETGETFGGVCRSRVVTTHPDSSASIEVIHIHSWNRILEMARKLAAAIKMGHVGVDILLDADQGPVVLEVNAKPDLAVQIANRSGLIPVLGIPMLF